MQKECTRQNNSIFVKLNNRYNIFDGIDIKSLIMGALGAKMATDTPTPVVVMQESDGE